MSPLGQLPDFLTDGSRIRCPPVGNTQNPIFRLAAHWHQRISDIWSRIRLPCLAFIYSACTAFQPFTYHASVSSVPIFIWSQVIITFSLSNIRFPGNRPPFFAVDFPCRFSKKLPVLFYVQHFSPLSASLFNVFLRPTPSPSFTRHLPALSPPANTFIPPRLLAPACLPVFRRHRTKLPPLSPPSHPLSWSTRPTCPQS